MTDEWRATKRGWLHAPITRVELVAGGYAHLIIPNAWNVDIPLDVAVQLDAKPGTMVSFDVADTSDAGGDTTLYKVAIGEVLIWVPGEQGESETRSHDR